MATNTKTLAEELSEEVDKLHALMHDEQGKGMWVWWVSIKNSIDRLNTLMRDEHEH